MTNVIKLLNTVVPLVTVTITSQLSQLVSGSHLTNYQNSDNYRRPAVAPSPAPLYNIDPIFVESDTFRGHDQYARSPVTVTSPSPQHYHPYQQYPYYPSLTPSTPSPPRSPAPTPFSYPYPPIPTYPTPLAPLGPVAAVRSPGHTPAITFLDPDPLEQVAHDQIEVRHRSFTPRPPTVPPTQEAGVSSSNVNNEHHHTLDTHTTVLSPEANNEVQ